MKSGPTTAGLSVAELEDLARRGRLHVIRAVAHANGGHIGGPLSAMDMMVALYFRIMRIRPAEPHWPDRDRFVLSKGHSAIGLYSVLAMRGYFPEAELSTFDGIDSRLQGHPDMKITPGIDMSSGSLGLGFSGGLGIALGARAAGRDFDTYILLGDGECNEGVIWEAAHVAQRYALGNLVAIIDHNKLQQFGWRGSARGDRLPPYTGTQLVDRWTSFGWTVMEMDGHDMAGIIATVEAARDHRSGPVAIVAHTVKGKGVSFMEGNYEWHTRVPTAEELRLAVAELTAADASGAEGGAR